MKGPRSSTAHRHHASTAWESSIDDAKSGVVAHML